MLICHYLSFEKVFFWKAISTGFFDPKIKRFRRQHNRYAINGVADLILCIDSKLFAWEIKNDVGVQSASQKIFEARLIKEGKGTYVVLRSLEDAKRELAKIRNTSHSTFI